MPLLAETKRHEESGSVERIIENKAELRSPVLPPYSFKALQTILKAYGIPFGADEKLPQDNTRQFDLYAYPLKALTPTLLLEDHIQYFLAKKSGMRARRVCFLLGDQQKQPLALIIQLSQLDSSSVQKLSQQLTVQGLQTAEAILKNAPAFALFKQLYRHTHCLFLGSASNPELINSLKAPIQQACSHRVQLDFKAMDAANRSIALTEHIITMLKDGKTEDVNVSEAMARHRKQCIQSFLSALERLRLRDVDRHAQIQELLTILFKYMALDQHRATHYGIKEEGMAQWETLLACDQQAKNVVYQSDIAIERGLTALDFNALIQLVSLQDAPDQLLAQLQSAQSKHCQSIQQWEAAIQQKMLDYKKNKLRYCGYLAKKAGSFLYRNSLVSLGTELVHWMGQSIAQWIPPKDVAEIKDIAQRAVKLTVLMYTLSPRLAKRSQEAARRQLDRTRKNDLSPLFKISGASVGFVCSYSMGSYALIRAMGISLLSLRASDYARSYRHNDQKAQATPVIRFASDPRSSRKPHTSGAVAFLTRYVGDPSTYMRITSAAVATLEAFYLRSPQPLVAVLGGLSGSVAATTVAQRYFPDLRIATGQRPTEDQVFILFLFSIAGRDVGQVIMGYGFDSMMRVVDKLQARERVVAQLKKLETEGEAFDVQPERPSALNPRFWMHADNRISLTWRGRDSFFYHAECEVRLYPAPGVSEELACTLPTVSPARLG